MIDASSRKSPGRIGCSRTKRKPSRVWCSIEPPGVAPSGSPLERISSGSTTLGMATTAVSRKTGVSPAVAATSAKSNGAATDPICCVTLFVVTACIRCVRGTTVAVSADRAG